MFIRMEVSERESLDFRSMRLIAQLILVDAQQELWTVEQGREQWFCIHGDAEAGRDCP